MNMPRKRTQEQARQVEEALEREEPAAVEIPRSRDMLSTGSTLLNLACSDNPFGGFLRGKYYWLVGDSTSGKTFLSMTCFAEACRNRRFKGYRLIYDNIEDGCLMDVARFFGPDAERRIEPPRTDKDGQPRYSSVIEEFYYNLDDAAKMGTPFIYVLDSMDALLSRASEKKFEEAKRAFRKGAEAAGEYSDGKAKQNSEKMRKALKGLHATGSILIVVSQTRDNLGAGYAEKTHAGGRALKFYATTEIWSSVVGKIKKDVRGKPRVIGQFIRLQVRKNRITGKSHDVVVPIYPSYGIDDVGSCVDWLVAEGYWTKSGNVIKAVDLGFEGNRAAVIEHIEETGQTEYLQETVGRCWGEIQAACALKRRSRYGG